MSTTILSHCQNLTLFLWLKYVAKFCHQSMHQVLNSTLNHFMSPFLLWMSYQRCPEATAQGDFASYSCPMRRLLFRKFMYSACTGIVNVVIFAAYSSQCAVYFEKCGQRWSYLKTKWHANKFSSCTCVLPFAVYMSSTCAILSIFKSFHVSF